MQFGGNNVSDEFIVYINHTTITFPQIASIVCLVLLFLVALRVTEHLTK